MQTYLDGFQSPGLPAVEQPCNSLPGYGLYPRAVIHSAMAWNISNSQHVYGFSASYGVNDDVL